MRLLQTPLPLAALALLAAPLALGHSWIEQMRVIDESGNYVGEYGYPRGFKSKNAKGYNSETDMNYLLPPIKQQPPFIRADNLLCHPNQRKPTQSENFPRLQATPGSWVALRYAENGHVSNPSAQNGHVPGQLDKGRREKGGSIFIFGTTEPKEEEKIVDVLRWTKDGQGGDRRGVLLAVNNYDDGRCYEINPVTGDRQKQFPNFAEGQAVEGAPGNFPLMCESNAQLPKDAPSGKPYTLYWVWQWPMEPGQVKDFPKGKDEYYTTCMDVDVVDALQQTGQLQFALQPQDAMSKAVQEFRSRTALITDPIQGEVGPFFSEGGGIGSQPTPTGGAPQVSQPPTSATPSGAPTTMVTSVSAPPSGSPEIPTLTQRPGEEPSASPAPGEDDDVVRITVTERITVTAPVVTPTAPAQKRSNLVTRHGARFRI
jgi:hypothetical protein